MGRSICIVLLFLTTVLSGQNWNYRQYTQAQGLRNSYIVSITQDKSGFLWLGTQKGIERFDGQEFQTWEEIFPEEEPLGSYVYNLFCASDGTIWASVDQEGVIAFNPATGKVLGREKNESLPFFPKGESYCFFEAPDGKFWAGVSGKGLAYYKPEEQTFASVTLFRDEETLRKEYFRRLDYKDAVAQRDKPHVFWLSSVRGITVFDTRTHEFDYLPLLGTKGLNPELRPPHIRTLYQAPDGYFWANTHGQGLFKVHPETYEYEIFTCVQEVKEPDFTCLSGEGIFPLPDDKLLLHSARSAWHIFDMKTEKFTDLTENISTCLPSTSYELDHFTDRDGSIWMASLSAEIGLISLQVQDKQFTKVKSDYSLYEIIEDPLTGLLYAITQGGDFLIFDEAKQSLQAYRVKQPRRPMGYGLRDIHLHSDGRIYLLGAYDLYVWNAEKKEIEVFDSAEWREKREKFGYYWDFAFDEKDRVYISSQGGGLGVVNLRDKSVKIFDFEKGNPRSLKYNFSFGNLTKDEEGRIWGSGEGVFIFSPEEETFINLPSPLSVDNSNKIFDKYCDFLPLGDGLVFAAFSPARQVILDTKTTEFSALNLSDYAPEAAINGIVQTQEGEIWLGSNAGLTRISADLESVQHFGTAYNLRNIKRLSLTAEGEILAATTRGFYRFQPSKIQTYTTKAKPVLTDFKIFEENYPGDSTVIFLKNAELTYEQNFFSLRFGVLDFSQAENYSFYYQLEGVDPRPVDAKDRRYVSYNNLEGGDYSFRLVLQNKAVPEDRAERVLNLRVHPPFYKTWWFRLLSVLAFAALLYGIYTFRIGQVKKEEAMKTEFNQRLAEVEMKALRAQMNPHFLFNSMNAIKFYVLKRSKEQAAEYLNDFSKLIRLVLQNSAKKLIPLADELKALDLYINIERLRFDDKFDYDIEIGKDIDVESIMIPPLILQPYAENAVWHGLMHKKEGRGKLKVEVLQERNKIICVITDNGIGRRKAAEVKSKSAQNRKSMGMNITRSRVDLSNQMFENRLSVQTEDLFSQEGKAAGTQIKVMLELND